MKPINPYQITVGQSNFIERKDGEQLTIYQNHIINSLLSDSANKTLSTGFSPENQQLLAEELGYRRALLEFLSYFSSQENN